MLVGIKAGDGPVQQVSTVGIYDVSRATERASPVRWLILLLAIAFIAQFAWQLAMNPNLEWHTVISWLFEPTVIQGLGVTLGLAVAAMIIGTAIGLLLAIARMSDSVLARTLSGLYIWFFRGTPMLVQLIFWYNLATIFPTLSIGVPFGPTFLSWETNTVITPLTAAIVGLALNEAAYMAEVIRGGLLSVDPGQKETAQAFGMTRARALRRIIIPQAMRAIIPPTGNQFISLIKGTSLVSVIAMNDLLYSVQAIYNRTFEIIPLLLVAVIWYLVVTSILNVGQSRIEAYYGRGDRSRNAGPAGKIAEINEEAAR
jgi:polar amino acid transport system permease protein